MKRIALAILLCLLLPLTAVAAVPRYTHRHIDKSHGGTPAIQAPGAVQLALGNVTLTGGNGNGKFDPNECNQLAIQLTNNGDTTATLISAMLYTETTDATIFTGNSAYSDIPPGGSAVNDTIFNVSTAPTFSCGQVISFTLSVDSSAGNDIFTFDMSSAAGYSITEAAGSYVPGGTDSGNHCDDCVTNISLPFPVTFYYQQYNAVNVSSNGTLQFTGALSNYDNYCLPASDFTNTLFLHWDDLETVSSQGGIYTTVNGTAPNRTFLIDWRTHYADYPGQVAKFEVRFTENSPHIEVIYGQVDGHGQFATVGIQKDLTDFVPYSCNTNSINSGLKLNIDPQTCADGGGECSGASLIYNSSTIDDSAGDGDGLVDYNECVQAGTTLQNIGSLEATNISAVLSTTTPSVHITQPLSTYPDVPPGGEASNDLPFRFETLPSFVCGTPIDFVLTITSATGVRVVDFTSTTIEHADFTQGTGSIDPGLMFVGAQCDDCTASLVLPFAVQLYDQTFNNATVSSNGVMYFGLGPQYDNNNTCLPAAGFTYAIFPYWDDLNTAGMGKGVFKSVVGTAPNRILNVEWRGVKASDSSPVNFEIRLFEGMPNHFEIVYAAGDGAGATVGVQKDATIQTQFACNSGGITAGEELTTVIASCGDGGGPCAGTTCPDITLAPEILPDAPLDVPYYQTISASGGTFPYIYAITAGALPPGLQLNPDTGEISGTPGIPATYNFTMTVVDAYGCPGTHDYSIVVPCPVVMVSPSILPDTLVGAGYSQFVSATGGTEPYNFAISAGSLPPGLGLNIATGEVHGSAIVVGSFNFTVTATDAYGCAGSQSYTISTTCPSVTLLPDTLPDGLVGNAYSQTLTASGGTPPYSFIILAGTLPSGLHLSNLTGTISGTPLQTGIWNFTVKVSDYLNCPGTMAYSMSIECGAITISPAALPDGKKGTLYNQTVSASGGKAPYHYTISSGALPPGLGINQTSGTISGNPTVAGTYDFEITATDSAGCAAAQAYSIVIQSDTCTVDVIPDTLPDPVVSVAYSQSLSISGGVAPYTFQLVDGALPAGLSLSTGGAITGTPTAEGPATFTIEGRDSAGCTGTQVYNVTVAPGGCLFCDDFEDGILDPSWTQIKPAWTEANHVLTGTPTGRKASIINKFAGCLTCYEETQVTIADSLYSKVWVYGWYADNKNTMELLISEGSDKIILRQRVDGKIVVKNKGLVPITPGVPITVRVAYDGTQFVVSVGGTQLFTLHPVVSWLTSGTVGFGVKNTTATFGYITVN